MTTKSNIPADWQVPPELSERLGAKVGRQRALQSDGHLMLALHAPPKPDEHERRGRYFWRKPDGTWADSSRGTGLNSLQKHLNEYADILEEYDDQEERAVSAEDHFAILEGLAPIHRAAQHLHQVLQEARQLCPQDRSILDFRDRAYEIERTAGLLYNGAKSALDFTVAKRAEEEARSSHRMAVAAHRLNILAAFFFPIATLGAAFGMNLEHRFEKAWVPYPFVAVIVVGLILGVVLKSFVTRPYETAQARLSARASGSKAMRDSETVRQRAQPEARR